jgi:hypothetical protein
VRGLPSFAQVQRVRGLRRHDHEWRAVRPTGRQGQLPGRRACTRRVLQPTDDDVRVRADANHLRRRAQLRLRASALRVVWMRYRQRTYSHALLRLPPPLTPENREPGKLSCECYDASTNMRTLVFSVIAIGRDDDLPVLQSSVHDVRLQADARRL